MNNPLEVKNGFQFELNFYDFNTGWIETPEPIGFDGAKFVKEQNDKGWARGNEWFAIDGLEFPNAMTTALITPRQINPRGDMNDHMDYCLEWFLSARKLKGSEMKVGFRILKFGVVFKEFECDVQDEKCTDGKNYFKCKMVQVGRVADHLRNAESTFDAFSDKNWKGDTITPMPSFKMLCKTPALFNTTVFKGTGSSATATSIKRKNPVTGFILETTEGANSANAIEESQINNTLSFISNQYATVSAVDSNGITRQVPNDSESFQYLEIQNDSFNVQFEFTDIDARAQSNFSDHPDAPIVSASGYTNLLVVIGNDLLAEPFDAYELHRKDFGLEDSGIYNFPTTLSLNIPYIQRGKRVYVYYSCDSEVEFDAGIPDFITSYTVINQHQNHRCTISVKEKPLDYVIDVSRYVDLMKQSALFVNDVPVYAPRFDVGGKDHNIVVFNRAMVVGAKLEMNTTPKTVFESAMMLSGDVEYTKDKISVLTYPNYHQNIEIASFQILPSEDYCEPFNPRLMVNKLTYDFDTFENEKTVKGTSKGIHTQSEWRIPNERSVNKKEIKNKLVLDPFDTNTMIKLALTEPTTSTDKDEKIYAQKIIRLAPNSFNVIRDRLFMRWVNGNLEILNRDDLGGSSNTNIVWNGLGFNLGATVEIIDGSNVGVYSVFEVNTTVLKLTPATPISEYSGVGFVSIKYYYTGVLWQTSTNQNFSIAPEDYPNLELSIKRNLTDLDGWFPYLSALVQCSKKDIVNAKFLNNGEMTTQLLTETEPVVENGTIIYDNMPQPLVSPFLIKESIYAPFDEVLSMMERYDAGEKGFIRLWDLDGNVKRVFIQKFENTISTAKADIVGEEQFSTDYLKIDTTSDGLLVNDAPYNLQGVADWFITRNDEIQLFDEKSNPISRFYRYDFVILNGQQFNSINALVVQLSTYEWI